MAAQKMTGKIDTSLAEGGYMSVEAACELLDVSRSKLYGMMARGEITWAKFGTLRKLPRRAVLEWATRCHSA